MTKGVLAGCSELVFGEDAMKRKVSRQHKEAREAVEAVAEMDAWDIAVRIWDGTAMDRTSGGKILTMGRKESAARFLQKAIVPKRKITEKRAAA